MAENKAGGNMTSTKYCLTKIAVAAAIFLSGCGGGEGSALPDISGRVVDGYIKGAVVFWDCNNNGVFDLGEVSSVTDADGRYVIKNIDKNNCPLLAFVSHDAIDMDRPYEIARSPYTMQAVSGKYDLITPFTTLIAGMVASDGVTINDANTALAGILGVGNKNLLIDFIGNGDPSKKDLQVSAIAVDIRKTIQYAALNNIPAGPSVFNLIKNRYSDSNLVYSVSRGVDVFDYVFTSAVDRVSKFYSGNPSNILVRRAAFAADQDNSSLNNIANKVNSVNGALYGYVNWDKFSDDEIKNFFLEINRLNAIKPISERSADLQEIQKRRNFIFQSAGISMNSAIDNENKLSTFFTNDPGATIDYLFESISISSELIKDFSTISTPIPKIGRPSNLRNKIKLFLGQVGGATSMYAEGAEIASSYAKCVKSIYDLDAALDSNDDDYNSKTIEFISGCGAFVFDSLSEIQSALKNKKLSKSFNVVSKIIDNAGSISNALTETDKQLIVYKNYSSIFGAIHDVVDFIPSPVAERFNATVDIAVQALNARIAAMELEIAANEKRDEKYNAAFNLYQERAAKIWRNYYLSFMEIYYNYYFRVVDSSACSLSMKMNDVGVCVAVPIASVSSIQPKSAVLNQAATIFVTGQNLPLTPTMTLGGIPCQIQSSPVPTASGFTAVCTPGGTAGNQAVKITDASGVVLDQSRVINISDATAFKGILTGWDGLAYSTAEILQKDGYVTKATSNWGVMRLVFDRQINGDNFKIQLRAKNDPALDGGVSAYDLGFGVTNEMTSGKFDANGVNIATKWVTFVMTNGYFQDFFDISTSVKYYGWLSQSGALNTNAWHKYVLEVNNKFIYLYMDDILKYSQEYDGALGVLDNLYIRGKFNFQLDPSSIMVVSDGVRLH